MAKFVIECPKKDCGKYIQVSNSLFLKRSVRCSCGEEIDIKANLMTSRECPHCGNTVVFNAAKGQRAKCPVCKGPINTMEYRGGMHEFSCGQCGIRLHVSKKTTDKEYKCPACDFSNNIQAQLAKEKAVKDGVATHIKYEGDNETFIWKHPVEDFNLGSQVTVHESQEAVFFRDGQALDTLGPGRHTLETQSIPLLNKFYKLPTHPQQVFHAEIYFINMTTQMGIKWGTPEKISVLDPNNGFYVKIGAGGEFNLKVSDSRRLLMKLVGTTGGLKQSQLLGGEGSAGYFRALIITEVKTLLPQIIRQEKVDLLQPDGMLKPLSEGLQVAINRSLKDYGLEITEFYVTRIITPDADEDPNFAKLQQQYADRVLKVRENQIEQEVLEAARERKRVAAQTDAEMKIIAAQAEAEAKRQQIMVEAEEMHRKGYTYQQETGRQVANAAARNLGSVVGGGGSGLGDIVGLGMAMGTMGTIADTTREAMRSITEPGTPVVPAGSWTCECGIQNTGKFCFECGKPRPQPKEVWKCECGAENTGKFCAECGKPKPQAPEPWKCACGAENTGKFCAECGKPKPQAPETWNCSCGNSGITGKFCPECGKPKGE